MKSNAAFVRSRDPAILEALLIARATVMFQTVWHTHGSRLFEEMERFNNQLQDAGSAPANVETSPATRTGGITWKTH